MGNCSYRGSVYIACMVKRKQEKSSTITVIPINKGGLRKTITPMETLTNLIPAIFDAGARQLCDCDPGKQRARVLVATTGVQKNRTGRRWHAGFLRDYTRHRYRNPARTIFSLPRENCECVDSPYSAELQERQDSRCYGSPLCIVNTP